MWRPWSLLSVASGSDMNLLLYPLLKPVFLPAIHLGLSPVHDVIKLANKVHDNKFVELTFWFFTDICCEASPADLVSFQSVFCFPYTKHPAGLSYIPFITPPRGISYTISQIWNINEVRKYIEITFNQSDDHYRTTPDLILSHVVMIIYSLLNFSFWYLHWTKHYTQLNVVLLSSLFCNGIFCLSYVHGLVFDFMPWFYQWLYGHPQYLTVFTLYQYLSIIAIHYIHT